MTSAFNEMLATQVATLIAKDGCDWKSARHIIALDNGISTFAMPSDSLIESALREHYAIFDPQGHAQRLYELRLAALEAMRMLARWQPRLIRGALNGCADRFSNIHLTLCAEDAKQPMVFLIDHGIETEVLEVAVSSRQQSGERLVFEAPVRPESSYAEQKVTIFVICDLWLQYPSTKQKRVLPDRWQTPLEAFPYANIDDLEEILAQMKRSTAKD